MPMRKEIVRTESAPPMRIPISQGVKAGGFLYTSGMVPIDRATGRVVEGGIEAQTEQVFRNLTAILEAAGTSFDRVVKATVFLRDKRDFEGMNAVYRRYFPADPPARSTVQADLMVDARVEIELVAILG